MRQPTRGRAIAATILATLLLPTLAFGADPDRDKLQEIDDRLDRLRDKIGQDETKASGYRARVRLLNGQILTLRNEVLRYETKIARVQSEVRSAQDRIDRTQSAMDGVKDRAVTQAVDLYKAGATDTLDALLDSSTLGELDARIEMLGVAAQENTDALVTYGRLRERIELHHRELFKKKQSLERVEKERSAVLAALDERHQKLAAELRQIEVRLGARQSEERNLESAAEAIKADILASQAKNSASALGTSGQGFIWPLAGSITSYYGARWGRQHTGIDIDGTSGEPIVASKSGVVTLASSYSGYGNAVVVDHGGGIATLYAHMSSFAVSAGRHVSRGQIVGRVGCTGSCTGDHLHFEVRVNGNPVDPLNYLP